MSNFFKESYQTSSVHLVRPIAMQVSVLYTIVGGCRPLWLSKPLELPLDGGDFAFKLSDFIGIIHLLFSARKLHSQLLQLGLKHFNSFFGFFVHAAELFENFCLRSVLLSAAAGRLDRFRWGRFARADMCHSQRAGNDDHCHGQRQIKVYPRAGIVADLLRSRTAAD